MINAWALLIMALVLGSTGTEAQQACTEHTGSVGETFSTTNQIDLPNCSCKFWCLDNLSPQGIMTLSKLGANFASLNPAEIPTWINAVAAGDFDLDGWTDFVGSSSSYSNVLAVVKNMGGAGHVGTFQISHWIDGCTGNASGYPTKGVKGAALDTDGHVSLTSGDYDLDGDIDFLFVASSTTSPYAFKRIWLYKNNLITNGVKGSSVTFTQVDMTSAWSSKLTGIAWSGTGICSLKFDSDSDIDIVFGNSAGKVLKLTNTNNGKVNASTFTVESKVLITTGWGTSLRGINAMAIADFDKDGDMDIVVGCACTNTLRYYKNDGAGNFTLFATFTDSTQNLHNNFFDGAATVLLADDFDKDGDADFVVGTDDWNYPANNGDATGYGGKVYFFRNNGSGSFVQTLLFDGPAQVPSVYDFDCGMVFDYNKDGVADFLIADGNHTENYYIFMNSLAPVFALDGQGVSLNLTPALDPNQQAITRIRMTKLTQSVLGGSSAGLSATYYVSNNNGHSWELYVRHDSSAITSYTDLPWHNFSTFGTGLRWKAVLKAPEDAMNDYTHASFQTPSVDEIALEYVYVDRREYSRTTDPVTTLTINGSNVKTLYAASFFFPGYQGQVRAYDLTNMAMTNTAASTLKTVSMSDLSSANGRTLASGAAILWDGGSLLNARTAASRTIYTSVGSPLARIDFSRGNVGTLDDLLQDNDADNEGLIDFIRGEGRDWKLGDIQHSNPVLLGPPSLEAGTMGSGYLEFAQALAGRMKVLFVGANDGMLHCFNATTGEEIWGYIPHNLLSKLKNLSLRDSGTGLRSIIHDYFVDGSPAVAEVQINGAWKTVLVCGQGAGKSLSTSSGLNFYFALDVTDPLDPRPLWEFTEATMGETWSIPAIGLVRTGSGDRWAAFTGSGYDNDSTAVVGNVFYTIALDTGELLRAIPVANVDTSGISRPFADIPVAIPGSPTALDANKDGYTDAVYVGDLDGRLWKMSTSNAVPASWTMTAIYTDHLNYPIITKPAVWQDGSMTAGPAHVLFGTGGDDNAPSDRFYAFLSVLDIAEPMVEWYLGNPSDLNLPAEKSTGALELGDKAWADPVIGDSIVYFNTLKGSIENVNPCLNLSESGRLYARFVQAVGGGAMGSSALKTASGVAESFQLTSKARRMVTIGDRVNVGQTAKREVYIQEYDSTVERLEQAITRVQLIIKSWREVYQIIR
jgi:hypothetical protein